MSVQWLIYVRETQTWPDWIYDPPGTWWEDDTLDQPYQEYILWSWRDHDVNGELSQGDEVYMNGFWWGTDDRSECRWWKLLLAPHFSEDEEWEMTLEYKMRTDWDPTDPVCTWVYNKSDPDAITYGPYYHIPVEGWTDNNGDGEVGFCDTVDLMEYEKVWVTWTPGGADGEGRTLLPVTAHAWHVFLVEIQPLFSNVILHLDQWSYEFEIRTEALVGGPIYFVNMTGDIVDTFDIYDVEYSFERAMALDSPGGPAWMLWLPCLDAHYFRWTGSNDSITLGSYLIDGAFEIVSTDPPIFRINTCIDFPDIAFKQILSQTWASIMSKEYSIAHGDWNGELLLDEDQNCIPDWYETFWGDEANSYYEQNWDYVGTGPYYVSVVDDVNRIVVLERNSYYWMGWPAPGRKAYLDRVDIEYISAWETRRDAFIACQVDICAVPRAYMSELLDEYGEPKYPEIVTIKNIYPGLALDATHYTFRLNPASPYIGTGSFPDGIPPDFFNNTHIRKAFSYAFNRTQYIEQGYHGEAICRETPLISGLAPDYYSYGPDPPYTYDESLEMVMNELILAASDGMPTFDVWNQGFYLVASYNTGNDQRMIACNMLRDFFTELGTNNGRTGPPFVIDVAEIDWPTYINQWFAFNLPLWAIGWLSDYADADNWMGAYMHSWICFAYFQVYRIDNGYGTLGPVTGMDKDELIGVAVKTPDGPERAALYKDLEDIYIMDCPSYSLAEPLGRKWLKYWVKGWYHNALYPSDYYYHLYKENTCWCDNSGPELGVPDGVSSMRDINFIVTHFGASPPDVLLGYNPKWAPGTYGYAGCDVYGDRKVDMRDIGLACTHFGHTNEP